jgi:hypothetical protein
MLPRCTVRFQSTSIDGVDYVWTHLSVIFYLFIYYFFYGQIHFLAGRLTNAQHCYC